MIPDTMNIITRLRRTYEHRYEPEYARAFANLYWRSLLSLACIVVVGTFAYCAIVFFGALPQSSTDTPAVTSSIPAGANLNRAELESTLNGFAARQASFNALKTDPTPSVTDPSK